MKQTITLALDAMGGDHGPETTVPGAARAATRHPGMLFLLFGDEAKIAPLLDKYPKLKAVSRIRHSEIAVMMDSFRPLHVAKAAEAFEDAAYHRSWVDQQHASFSPPTS